jgi:hypothetical protein
LPALKPGKMSPRSGTVGLSRVLRRRKNIWSAARPPGIWCRPGLSPACARPIGGPAHPATDHRLLPLRPPGLRSMSPGL